MSKNELTTVSGKPLTMPTSTRLTVDLYQRAVAIAKKEGVPLATLLSRWISERLEAQSDQSG